MSDAAAPRNRRSELTRQGRVLTWWAEQVLAVVEPESHVQPGEALAAELLAFTRQRLAHFKCPRRTESDGLRRRDDGKPYRRLLRDTHGESVTASTSGGDNVQ